MTLTTTEKIDEILRRHDIEGLLELGAPRDEYRDEANAIADTLKQLGDDPLEFEDLLLIVTRVWQTSFNLDDQDMNLRKENIICCVHDIVRVGVSHNKPV